MSGTAIVPSSPPESQKNYPRIIAVATGLLTLLLAAFSFVLSFNALTDLAASHGISIPILFPLVVEAGVVIFSLNALYRSTQGESAKWQWSLIIASSVLAGIFNILHARTDLVSRIMAAMPSLFLLLSFETFLNQIKHVIKRVSVVQSIAELEADLNDKRLTLEAELAQKRLELEGFVQEKQAEVERLTTELEQLNTTIKDLEAKQASLQAEIIRLQGEKRTAGAAASSKSNDTTASNIASKEQALNALIDFYRSNPTATLNQAGQVIGRSKSTVSNYMNELETAGRIHRNEQGVEVVR